MRPQRLPHARPHPNATTPLCERHIYFSVDRKAGLAWLCREEGSTGTPCAALCRSCLAFRVGEIANADSAGPIMQSNGSNTIR